MKILKSNTKEVFDTENLNSIKRHQGKTPDNLVPLHHSHNSTDYEFLKSIFPLNHSIFEDFKEAFYYVIEP